MLEPERILELLFQKTTVHMGRLRPRVTRLGQSLARNSGLPCLHPVYLCPH